MAELKRTGHKVHKYLQRLYFLCQFFPLLTHNYLPYLERFHLAYLIKEQIAYIKLLELSFVWHIDLSFDTPSVDESLPVKFVF